MRKMMNILILSTAPKNYATVCLVHAGRNRGHAVAVVNPSDLYLLISNKESGYDRVYLSDCQSIRRINIKDFDAIIPRLGESVGHGALMVEQLTRNLGIFSPQSASGIRLAANKLMTLQTCSSHGIATSRTVYLNNVKFLDSMIEKIGGYPIVVKLTHGSGGAGVALIKDRVSAISVIQSLLKSRSSIILQEYINSGGKDYRAIVVGDKVVASFKRSATNGDFRANLQLGGEGKPVTLDPEDRQLCVRVAKILNLGMVGIDLIKDKTTKSYLIEANANFGFKVQKITGINIADQIIQYIEKNYLSRSVLDPYPGNSHHGSRNVTTSELIGILKRQLSYFTGNEYIRELYQKTKGKKIKYVDRDKNIRQITINRLQDLYTIMFETFVIK